MIKHFPESPGVDWAVGAALTGTAGAIFRTPGLDAKDASSVFATSATVVAIVAGFGTLAISIYLAIDTEVGFRFRAIVGRTVRTLWISSLSGGLVSAVLCVVALTLINNLTAAWWVYWAAVGLGTTAALRTVWLISKVLGASDAAAVVESRPIGVIKD